MQTGICVFVVKILLRNWQQLATVLSSIYITQHVRYEAGMHVHNDMAQGPGSTHTQLKLEAMRATPQQTHTLNMKIGLLQGWEDAGVGGWSLLI